MKRIVFLAVVVLMACTVLMAQENRREGKKQTDPKERAEQMTERMAKEYSLNDVQKQQLQELNLSMAGKMKDRQAMHQGKKGPKGKKGECKNQEMKKERKERSEVRKEEREKMHARMTESHKAYNAKVKDIFTPEQYAKYEKNQAERQAKMKERRENRDNRGKKMSK